MKITMYELYGKIYDENPPKHIRVYGEDWYWNDYDGYVTKESLKTTPDAQIYLMDRYRTFMNLDKEVEILEEEKEIPEKLPIGLKQTKDGIFNTIVKNDIQYELNEKEEIICRKINEIIDYLKSKGE